MFSPRCFSFLSLIFERQTYAFLQILFHALGDRFGSDFHIAGESYGGRYVPLFADYIVRENEKLKVESYAHFLPFSTRSRPLSTSSDGGLSFGTTLELTLLPRLDRNGLQPINLVSILVGNGLQVSSSHACEPA